MALMIGSRATDSSAPSQAGAREQQAQVTQAVQRGRTLMAQYQCGSCHHIPGVNDAYGASATSLAAFGQRSYIAGRIPNRPEMLARWIHHPQELIPSATMPALGVSTSQAEDMAAYLHSLK